ncbi:MAG: amino acid permease [Planctomycetia bacterium]|nr:amino acid permease [Planctomycetia bacterium]
MDATAPPLAAAQHPILRRELDLLDAVGVGLGAIIGAGIFVVTGLAAEAAGPAFVVGLLLAGVAALCNALSSAELAAHYPQAGGTYEYGYRLLHPLLGFSAGWMFLASKLAAGGTVALGFGGYLAQLLPVVPARGAAVAAVLLLLAANWFGIKKVGRLNFVVVSVTLAALGYFIVGGLPAFRVEHFKPFAPHGWSGIAEAAALLFFAYTGYARLATLGEEVRDPARTIPRAILITVLVSAVLYLAVGVVAVGAVGAGALAGQAAPLEEAARASALPGCDIVVAVGATTAMLGVLLSQMLGISRMLFALGRRGDLPACFAWVHPRHGVPGVGILLTGAIVLLLSLVGTLTWIVSAVAFTILLYYGITNLAALHLPPEQKRYPRVVAWLGLACCILLGLSLRVEVIGAGLALLVLGHLPRWLWRGVAALQSATGTGTGTGYI